MTSQKLSIPFLDVPLPEDVAQVEQAVLDICAQLLPGWDGLGTRPTVRRPATNKQTYHLEVFVVAEPAIVGDCLSTATWSQELAPKAVLVMACQPTKKAPAPRGSPEPDVLDQAADAQCRCRCGRGPTVACF